MIERTQTTPAAERGVGEQHGDRSSAAADRDGNRREGNRAVTRFADGQGCFGENRRRGSEKLEGDQYEHIDGVLLSKLNEVLCEAPSIAGAWLVEPLLDAERSAEGQRDFLATRLMETFRIHQSRAAFGLLYELYGTHLLQMVASRLRRYQSKADPNDVLQEVYVNIYRYPHRFDSSRDDAFRLWTSTIVRNTVLKHLRSLSRSGRAEVGIEDLPEPPEPRENGPLQGVLRNEARQECGRVYLTYLHLYLQFYRMLSEREQRAIHLVEVDECSYRDAAAVLGIKLENLKMVIFRARRKIHRSMKRVFEGLPPDVRPARTPRAASGRAGAVQRDSGQTGSGRSKIAGKVGAGSKVKSVSMAKRVGSSSKGSLRGGQPRPGHLSQGESK